MAGFLYYLAGEEAGRATALGIERLKELGLAYAFGDSVTPSGLHRNGPDGGSGVIVAAGGRVKKVGYYPGEQTWRQIPRSMTWIGYYTEQRPRPSDLSRDARIPGHGVELLDGQAWEIPLARGWSDGEQAGYYEALPRAASTIDEAGDWVPGEIDAKYSDLWEIATGWWDAKHQAIVEAVGDEDKEEEEEQPAKQWRVEFDFAGLHDKALAALAVNYRLSRLEAAVLGLLDQATAIKILDAVVDWPTYFRWMQKKTAPEPPDG